MLTNDPKAGPLVSVVIPTYNHAHFLPDAINSVRAQSYAHHEIVVVDDGSTDDTKQVVTSFPDVKYLYQKRNGPSVARNAGMRASTGSMLTFLDADDLLLPNALEAGVSKLAVHTECAFVSGNYRVVGADRQPTVDAAATAATADHYLALLRMNYIGMLATVMYRREALESVGGFDVTVAACEDYDLYLRISRTRPVFSHDEVVADYRWHEGNRSFDPRYMLKWALRVLRRQWPYVAGDPERTSAYTDGERQWRSYFAGEMQNLITNQRIDGLAARVAARLFVLRNRG